MHLRVHSRRNSGILMHCESDLGLTSEDPGCLAQVMGYVRLLTCKRRVFDVSVEGITGFEGNIDTVINLT